MVFVRQCKHSHILCKNYVPYQACFEARELTISTNLSTNYTYLVFTVLWMHSHDSFELSCNVIRKVLLDFYKKEKASINLKINVY